MAKTRQLTIQVFTIWFTRVSCKYFPKNLQYSMNVWSITFRVSNQTDLIWYQETMLIAFWKLHYLGNIWFSGNFVNMYPFFHEHFLLIQSSWTNFLLRLGEIHVFILLEFISLSVFVIRGSLYDIFLTSDIYSVINVLRIFLSVKCLMINPLLCLH